MVDVEALRPIPVLTGPTAVGKSAFALDLAASLNAEIISTDSRQVYRELTIGTAKPDAADLSRVPHHFIDERSLGELFSAGSFQAEAYQRIREIAARGRRPLIVGGSTLYLHALQHGLADIPKVPASVRSGLRARLDAEGKEALFDELGRIDPVAAAAMDATKTQRVLRALEVYAATGRTLSSFHDAQTPVPFSFRTVILHRDRPALYDRINARVDAMFEAGLLDEVSALLAAGHDLSVNPLRTIGYKEPIAYLRGEIPRSEMIRLVKRNTRRYAKRQLTWFRRDDENDWIDLGREPANVRDDVLRAFERTG